MFDLDWAGPSFGNGLGHLSWSSPVSGLEGALTELGVGSRAGKGDGVGELAVGIETLGDGTDIAQDVQYGLHSWVPRHDAISVAP
jgi:hypothetical protein